ncbi:uncharacterized protein TM35_000121400 [Trypanosoma theileri]|uniref:Transmembrane protein n=1 Tax=Trypanosoma theileri TaxID=67003 RepID=A0A1X0NXE2_9TRYP|nr:uncharacterized protein TM35_000121400 [Trypanosoma theileri]ORC89365.1 hypothetical protein TM35_000121400 [Trypanosoma theileri]
MKSLYLRPVMLLLLSLLVLLFTNCGVDAWNFGEVIPVTIDLRLQREAPNLMVARDDVDDAEDMADNINNQNDNEGIPPAGMARGKVYTRPLPPEFCPRFGINRRVHHPAHSMFEYAHNTSRSPKQSLQDIAVRFQLERGLGKATAWIPLLQQTLRPSPFARQQPIPTDAVPTLAVVHFYFGYQGGTFNKLTTFRVDIEYSKTPHDDVELHYHWDEHRAYNPHRALSACAFVSVIATVVILHFVILRNGKFAQRIRKGQIIVRNHKE